MQVHDTGKPRIISLWIGRSAESMFHVLTGSEITCPCKNIRGQNNRQTSDISQIDRDRDMVVK